MFEVVTEQYLISPRHILDDCFTSRNTPELCFGLDLLGGKCKQHKILRERKMQCMNAEKVEARWVFMPGELAGENGVRKAFITYVCTSRAMVASHFTNCYLLSAAAPYLRPSFTKKNKHKTSWVSIFFFYLFHFVHPDLLMWSLPLAFNTWCILCLTFTKNFSWGKLDAAAELTETGLRSAAVSHQGAVIQTNRRNKKQSDFISVAGSGASLICHSNCSPWSWKEG